jgi:hypothetical protein
MVRRSTRTIFWDAWDDEDEPRPLHLPEAPEQEDDAAFVFLQHFDGAEEQERDEEQNDESELHR